MIDFLKIEVTFSNIQSLVNNDHLDFYTRMFENTGIIQNYPKTAEYKNMKFILKKNNYLRVQGSLHKFVNNGINYDDFTYSSLKDGILELSEITGIKPEDATIRNIEFGVNINTDLSPHYYLNRMISYKGIPLDRMQAKSRYIGKDCYLQHYGIKIYNKGFQCDLPDHILRFEVKVVRMIMLKKIGIYSLKDLLDKDKLEKLKNLLLKIFNNILFYDPDLDTEKLTKREKQLYELGKNPLYWEELKRNKRISRTSIYKQLNEFRRINNEYGNTSQLELLDKIKKIWSHLLSS